MDWDTWQHLDGLAIPNQNACGCEGFHNEGKAFEVFWSEYQRAWYWQPRQPGEPEGNEVGPFNTSEEAFDDAVK